MSQEYRVRRATPEDKPKILKLVEHTWSWGDYIPSVIDGWLSGGGGFVFVCFSGDELVGMNHLSIEEGGLGWLEGARVAVNHRNRGVATMLAQHAIDHARSMGLSKLRLAVAADNAPSLHHVGKVGFRPLARFRRLGLEVAQESSRFTTRVLGEGDFALVFGSESYSAYAGLYYKSFRWLDLDGQALKRLGASGRALWVGDHLLVHASDYEGEPGRVAEVGYAQFGDGDLKGVAGYFASKWYSRVDFVVPEGLSVPGGGLKEEGQVFIVFELKL